MSAKIIDGKQVANLLRKEMIEMTAALKAEKGVVPGLAVVLVGDDPASSTYVRMKAKACSQVGLYSEVHRLDAQSSEETVLALVDQLNNDEKIHGILVQLPLPKHIDEMKVIESIIPAKDVDGFHPINAGKLFVGEDSLLPCTPYGIMELLAQEKVNLKGKNAVVVGRSNIVGKPIAMLLLRENATVTICHSRTIDLAQHTKNADVLVVAVGRPEFITGDMIKPGAVVIDVGVNRVDDRLVGDVEFDSAVNYAGSITPVPGGVGPMTITMLLRNTIIAASRC